MDVLAHTHAPLWQIQIVEKPIFTLHSHSQLFSHTHTHTHRRRVGTHTGTLGHWGNDNKDMLMCANDVVISWRVQMEREINTDATGSEVWVHWHVCVRLGGGRCVYCMDGCWDSCACMCVSLPAFTKPRFPSNFDLLRLPSIPQEDALTPEEKVSACVFACPDSQMSRTRFLFFLSSVFSSGKHCAPSEFSAE